MFAKVRTASNYLNLNGLWLPVLESNVDKGSQDRIFSCVVYDVRLSFPNGFSGGHKVVNFYGIEVVATCKTPDIPLRDFPATVYGVDYLDLDNPPAKGYVEIETVPGHFLRFFYQGSDRTVLLDFFDDVPERLCLEAGGGVGV